MGGAVGLGHACGRRIAPAFAAIHGGPDVLVLRETAEPELTIGLD